jgi:hypothetical protein
MSNESHEYIFWDNEFLLQKNIIARLAAVTKEEIRNRLNEVEQKVSSSSITFDELIDLCYQIVCRIPIPLVKIDVPFIIRCRPNEPNKIFKHISEISYNANINKITSGRFNLQREPMFYSVSPSKSKIGFPIELAAIFESCKELNNPHIVIASERYVTIGYWKVVNQFLSVALTLYDDPVTKNQSMQHMNAMFEKILENKFVNESREIISIFYNYISKKAGSISENNNDYLITTAFRHALEKYYGKEIKAILYPSAMSDNHCINVAVTRETVDKKDIIFEKAQMFVITKQKKIDPFTHYAYANDLGLFEFTFIK